MVNYLPCLVAYAHVCCIVWIGPDQHIVQNTTHNGGSINWIANHKASRDLKESWSEPGSIDDAVALVKDWDPTIVNTMKLSTSRSSLQICQGNSTSIAPSCLDWLIVYRDPLPTWISKTGNVALMGDAAQYVFLHV